MTKPRFVLIAMTYLFFCNSLLMAETNWIYPEEKLEASLNWNWFIQKTGNDEQSAANSVANEIKNSTFKIGCCEYNYTEATATNVTETSFSVEIEYTSINHDGSGIPTQGSTIANGYISKIKACTNPDFPFPVDFQNDKEIDVCYKKKQCDEHMKGNPISCKTGRKVQVDAIYQGVGDDPLSYSMHYASPKHESGTDEFGQYFLSHLGAQRMDNHSRNIALVYDENGGRIYEVSYKSGLSYIFFGADNATEFESNYNYAGTLLKESGGSLVQLKPDGTTYRFSSAESSVETIMLPNGKIRTYTYTPTGKLKSITNHYGQQLLFYYDENDRLEKMLDPDLNEYLFEFDVHGNMSKVVFPDETPATAADNPYISYLFEDLRFPNSLTGKINEKGIRFATWAYDAKGRAISSEHAEGLEKVVMDFSVENQTRVTTYISESLSNDVIYHYNEEYIGRTKRKQLEKLEQIACADCEIGDWYYVYDDNGYLESKTSPSGTVFEYVHDENGLELQRIEAVGTPEQRTIKTDWDTVKRRVNRVTEGRLQTDYLYNDKGQVASVIQTDLDALRTRTTTNTYYSNGLLKSINGTRTDVDDVTTFAYDSNGNIESITNALNHITTFSNYDASGRVGTIIDSNGVETQLTYTSRGWLKTSTKNGLQTRYDYYPTGTVHKITMPAGQIIEYFYDDGERLIAIEDSDGNRIDYHRNLMGNVESTEVRDETGLLRFSQTNVYNALGQLDKIFGNNGQITDIDYDSDGSPVLSSNALSNSTNSILDAFKRVTKSIDPVFGETRYDYNADDQITKVTDALDKSTVYEYNAFGDLLKLTSADTGITSYTYDEAGNLKTRTDARGVVVNYNYDALNRINTISYPSSVEDITYHYDDSANGNKGIGRLTNVIDATGSTKYVYNGFGQVITETKSINGQTYAIEYDYDDYSRLSFVTYPSGRIIDYSYDNLSRVEGINDTSESVVTSLISGARYYPFGPLSEVVYGNGIVHSQVYDTDYRLVDKTTSIRIAGYDYDLVNNIANISDSLITENNQNFSYDGLKRLKATAPASGSSLFYEYDGIGNRTQKTVDSTIEDYYYSNSAHLLDFGSETSLYTIPPAASQLLAEWKLEDVAGSHVAEDTLAGINGYYRGNIGWEQSAAPLEGEAIYLDGEPGNYVAFGAPQALKLTKGTIDIWVKTADAGSGLRGLVIKEYVYGISLRDNEIVVHNWFNSRVEPTGVFINDDQWHNIVFVFHHNVTDGTKVYLDGVEVFSGTIWSNNYQKEGLAIGTGNHDGTVDNFKGYLKNFRIYNRVLSPSEIPVVNVNREDVFDYDANGNTIKKNDIVFDYNNANRMSSSINGGITSTYLYNAKGERSVKFKNGVETHYIYNLDGQLIAEGDSQGNIIREYVYFNGQPLAQLKDDGIYYYHNSHLGTPEIMTDEAQNIVWQASYSPFGQADISVELVENNIRFPGQYYDAESGLHYNYFRDYDPEIGRYIQSDPIGLNGGINTYGYVEGNPLRYIDPLGLNGFTPLGHISSDPVQWFCNVVGGCRNHEIVIDPDAEVGASIGTDDYGYELTEGKPDHDELLLPELGVGVSLCLDVRTIYDSCEDDSTESNIGLKYLGISNSKRKICVNLGIGVGLPYNQTK